MYVCMCIYRAKKKTDVLRGDIRGVIIPTLRDIRSELIGALEKLRSELHSTQDDIDESGSRACFASSILCCFTSYLLCVYVDVKLQESLQQRTLTESKLKRIEEAYAREKEVLDSAFSSYTSEVDAIESKLARIRDTSALDARVNIANRRIAEVLFSYM